MNTSEIQRDNISRRGRGQGLGLVVSSVELSACVHHTSLVWVVPPRYLKKYNFSINTKKMEFDMRDTLKFIDVHAVVSPRSKIHSEINQELKNKTN